MSMMQGLMAEFDHEASTTRKLLELIPDAKLSWKPHDKSFTLAQLSGHLATIPEWGQAILADDHFDLVKGAEAGQPPPPATTAEVLQRFDSSIAQFRSTAEGVDEKGLMAPWQLRKGDEVLMEMPRVACARSFIMNHIVHHRGQLTVYLRMLDVPLPSVYGPTADNPDF